MTTILFGSDLSEHAIPAARWAARLARLHQQDGRPVRLMGVHAISPEELSLLRVASGNADKDAPAQLQDEFRQWLEPIDTQGIEVEVNIQIGSPSGALVHAAQLYQADWLVVGVSGRGQLSRLILGSTAERLAHRPPCALALVHPDGFAWEGDVRALAPTDFSASATGAVELAADMVRRQGGALTLLNVVELPRSTPSLVEPAAYPAALVAHLEETQSSAQAQLDRLAEELDLGTQLTTEVRPGYPSHEVLAAAEEHTANLLFLGCTGRSRVAEWFLGGVARGVVRHAPTTIVLYPAVEAED
ncbi:hypothetical protein DL240_01050 [Lujinxingia litoralis]|uniref:UspA domain-containing protein n=1 Tax=Lujinxingia litoralis TaxID=2211119 RepID=A0A328CD62_9DELT|nr:universal stress protein [Lujinxingia litoralis]RAL24829.1 hypothetical protein DL240_01050 [Lujinxingia litoralis]